MTGAKPSRALRDPWLLGAVVAVLAIAIAHALFVREWGADDAYISYRYAKNLEAGHGLVFNPGERVEGYTNFLYVLLVAAGDAITRAGHYPVALAMNALALAAAVAVFVAHVDAVLGRAEARVAGALCVLCPILWHWVSHGLEAPVVVLGQIVIWATAERCAREGGRARDVAALAIACVASTLLRADGALVAFVAVGWLALRRAWRPAIATLAATAVTLGAHVAWRLSYYGWPLPNTYYAKVSGPLAQRIVHGLGDLAEIGLFAALLAPVLALVAASVTAARDARASGARGLDVLRALPFESAFGAVLLAYWVYIGGDVYAERFLLVLYPFGILSLLRVARRAPRNGRRALVAAFAAFELWPWINMRYEAWPKYDQWMVLGEHLRDHAPGAKTIAVDAAGKIPYLTGLESIDILGLNDVTIAHKPVAKFSVGHNKYDAAYVMQRKPDLVAAWIPGRSAVATDFDWGITRALYTANGYRVRWLLNTDPKSKGEDVIDVAGLDDDAIAAIVKRGYTYGVLERVR